MDRSVVIYLIDNQPYQDNLGIWQDNETERKVFAEVTSVSQSEWFEGGRNGLNPQLRFRVFRYDYQGEKVLKYDGVYYTIYRTYVGRDELIDLYTEFKKGNERP